MDVEGYRYMTIHAVNTAVCEGTYVNVVRLLQLSFGSQHPSQYKLRENDSRDYETGSCTVLHVRFSPSFTWRLSVMICCCIYPNNSPC